MRLTLLTAAAVFALALQSFAADPPTISKGKQILPKLDAVVKVGNELIDQTQFNLPWIVQDVNGDWLWVGDDRKGWVQRGQVVTLEGAPAYYAQFVNNADLKTWAIYSRAIAYRLQGNLDAAIADFGEALRQRPTALAYLDRGNAWRAKKDYEKAVADYNAAFHLAPNDADTFNEAAWLRATAADERFRNGKKAVELATKANELAGWKNPQYLDTLAAAAAEAGDFGAAIKHETQAIALSPAMQEIKDRLQLFKDHKAYHE
jgi:tetratricopeptide (TPR) repeat protein